MRTEFRDDFKSDNVLIVIGSALDMRAFSAGLRAWIAYSDQTSLFSIIPEYEGVEIMLQRHSSPHALTASDLPAGVLWHIGKDAARRLADLVGQLSRHPRPAHLYLHFEGYARAIIISMDEY
ncbi:hypothetical protein [Xanthomonas rydalmerensis]|uniref:Uncharacterized protein n=1 Tax=Xanthomonas rydalmerensis TaxID=3046274 RepID=A0ABZ0JQD6_9XANT|nr:hypothetical protein [Xanthomonas sp. DM-2023]WOS42039.1 hypothetical protein QN243_06195 [Xanthomonas sp. DM-2023]WOS46225.1 hypothetical protein QN242_06195 [Xanthomonas sp. DM-2023]WOS50404.1 hypothetical protein QN240_06195 [Xanthomonas sp. DM-2023]WOS54584.1 hypothetical protein QN244_06195 [Xanthomonas sp. DM-2023]WOS58767.1 hypothetical protein QN245_06195 [Xanthomonas sp. DM-2023]